jgi:hypothetical protein
VLSVIHLKYNLVCVKASRYLECFIKHHVDLEFFIIEAGDVPSQIKVSVRIRHLVRLDVNLDESGVQIFHRILTIHFLAERDSEVSNWVYLCSFEEELVFKHNNFLLDGFILSLVRHPYLALMGKL